MCSAFCECHCVVVFGEDGQFLHRIGCENITNYPSINNAAGSPHHLSPPPLIPSPPV